MKKYLMIVIATTLALSCTTLKPINNKTMHLNNNHTEGKEVSTKIVFNTQENKVISLQILKGKQLKEHITKVPAYLVCVTGEAIYADEKGNRHNLLPGIFVNIEPNVKHWVDATQTSNFLLIK